MYLATTPCAFRTRGSHRYRYIYRQDHTCQSTKNNLFVLSKDNKTGKTILWNCRRRNHGTLKEPTEPKEMTVFIATAFG